MAVAIATLSDSVCPFTDKPEAGIVSLSVISAATSGLMPCPSLPKTSMAGSVKFGKGASYRLCPSKKLRKQVFPADENKPVYRPCS